MLRKRLQKQGGDYAKDCEPNKDCGQPFFLDTVRFHSQGSLESGLCDIGGVQLVSLTMPHMQLQVNNVENFSQPRVVAQPQHRQWIHFPGHSADVHRSPATRTESRCSYIEGSSSYWLRIMYWFDGPAMGHDYSSEADLIRQNYTIYANCVGIFGMASAAYWGGRIGGALSDFLSFAMGQIGPSICCCPPTMWSRLQKH